MNSILSFIVTVIIAFVISLATMVAPMWLCQQQETKVVKSSVKKFMVEVFAYVNIFLEGILLAIGVFLILSLGIFSYKAFGTIFVPEEVPVIEDVQLSEKIAEFKAWFNEHFSLETPKERQEELARMKEEKKEYDYLVQSNRLNTALAYLFAGMIFYLYYTVK